MTTTDATAWWTQHIQRHGRAWAERLWEDWRAPHRTHLLAALDLAGPSIRSVYEFGCGSGPNLRLLRAIRPILQLGGCDVSPSAAAFASEQLALSIEVGALPEAADLLPPVDAVLTCYTLAYLDPPDVQTCLRLWAERVLPDGVLIVAEPMAIYGKAGLVREDLPTWQHPYQEWLPMCGWRVEWAWPVWPAVDGLNGCLLARRADD